MPISRIPGVGLDTGSSGVAPSNLSTGGPYWDGSGNVGIGTTSPTNILTISGGLDATYNANVLINSSASTAKLAFNPGGGGISSAIQGLNNGGLAFLCNGANTERARITSGGVLLVNTTTSASTGQVEIAKNGERCLTLHNTATGTTANEIINFIRNGTQVGNINTTGSATAYVTSSDYRLKENVQPMTDALAKVGAMKPCTYTWKVDGESGEGFIAHELAEVCPGAVSGEKDAINEDGSIKPQGIDTSFLVATLTAAIQELNAKVEAQAAEIAALKGAV